MEIMEHNNFHLQRQKLHYLWWYSLLWENGDIDCVSKIVVVQNTEQDSN